MIALWERTWFIKMITWLNDNWSWFKKYIYGNSINMQDFVRNPAEVLKHTTFPFTVKNVGLRKSLLNLRIGYIPFKESLVNDYIMEAQANTGMDVPARGYHEVMMGENKLIIEGKKWRLFDLRIWNDVWTKYCNSLFFFQIIISFKYKFIPIPLFCLCIRFKKNWYFQTGIGWSPGKAYDENGQKDKNATTYNACFTSKFLFVKFEKEVLWNGSDVYGFYEGTI
jgi:hypothetical protein